MSQVSAGLRPRLARTLHDAWWLFLVRGLLALAVGVIALVDPGATIAALVLLLGIYFIADGIFSIVKALGYVRSDRSWWMLLVSGLIGIAAGVIVFAWPGLTALALGYLIGIWAVVTGLSEMYVAFSLRSRHDTAWLHVIFGLVSIAFGVFVALVPTLGLTYVTLLIAIYGFVAGVALIGVAFRLRGRSPKTLPS